MRAPLPDDACSYWTRAQIREIDAHDFGFAPPCTDADIEREEREDDKDPPCTVCTCCRAFPEPQCGCGSSASHEHDGDQCCGGSMCCAGANQ